MTTTTHTYTDLDNAPLTLEQTELVERWLREREPASDDQADYLRYDDALELADAPTGAGQQWVRWPEFHVALDARALRVGLSAPDRTGGQWEYRLVVRHEGARRTCYGRYVGSDGDVAGHSDGPALLTVARRVGGKKPTGWMPLCINLGWATLEEVAVSRASTN